MLSRTLSYILGTALTFLWGAYAGAYNKWPVPTLREMRAFMRNGGALPVEYDAIGALVRYPGKIRITCPKQTNRTMVLLALGQSNAANSGGQRYTSRHGNNVVNYFDGKCWKASSPLLGSYGDGGEIWTEFANTLLDGGAFDHVIILPMGIGGANIGRWHTGDLGAALSKRLAASSTDYFLTDLIWVQGEADALQGRSFDDYLARMQAIFSKIRQRHPQVRIFVNVGTKCDGNQPWHLGNEVRQALLRAPNVMPGIYAGVDTDRLLTHIDRRDACHWGSSGQSKVVRALVDRITSAPRQYMTHGSEGRRQKKQDGRITPYGQPILPQPERRAQRP